MVLHRMMRNQEEEVREKEDLGCAYKTSTIRDILGLITLYYTSKIHSTITTGIIANITRGVPVQQQQQRIHEQNMFVMWLFLL